MSRNSGYQLSTIVFGLAVCLTTPACRTCQEKGGDAGEVSAASDAVRDVLRRLNEIIIPEMTFFPPATIADALDFIQQASRDYDKPGTPPERRGVSFVLQLPPAPTQGEREAVDPFDPFYAGASANCIAPRLVAMSVRAISLYDALQLVCEATDMRCRIRGDGGVMLSPKGWPLDEDGVTRSYNIPAALSERLFSRPDGAAPDADPNKVWQAFFDQLGVSGPAFAKFEYVPYIDKLRVTNTPENLAVIETVFDEFALRMVEVEMQIHAFRTKDIERLRLSGGESLESLMALRQNGKAKPVAAATALTKSGQEACVKAGPEVTYPTELVADGGQTGSSVTSRSAANALLPGNFEMRETGMILQVVPEVTHSGTLINLTLNPKWVTLEGWESYPADLAAGWTHKTLSFKQPVFGVTSFQTQATVKDGGTVLLGSISTPDGEWVQVGFLTTRLRDVHPRLSGGRLDKAARELRGGRTDKAKPQGEHKDAEVAQKLHDIVIPEMTFRPPATIIDAVRFLKEASITYDKPEVPAAQRGFGFVLKLPPNGGGRTEGGENADPFAAPGSVTNSGAPVIPVLSARFISLYDALKIVCDVTDMTFKIRDGIVWIVPQTTSCDDMITRSYPVVYALFDDIHAAGSSHVDDVSRKDWKTFFALLGVNWPTGSSIAGLDAVGLLRVTNTPENLDVFEQALADLTVYPRMVAVEMQILAFRPEDFEQLRLSGGVSVEALTALRQKGRAKPVASAMVVTKAGQEAVMKSVREVLYPTELLTEGGQAGSNSTSRSAANAVMPGNFEMRETGMVFQFIAEFAEGSSLINVMSNPQWVTLDRWESHPAELAGWARKKLLFRQPVFGVTSFLAQVTVEDGGTVLFGSCSTPDGKWVHAGFLTVKSVDVKAGLLECKHPSASIVLAHPHA